MFRLRVLGGFALDAAAPPFPKRRAEAVLAVLAVCGDLGCTRERLIALLWPESDEAHSRHGLRDALHAIRHALGPDAVRSAGDHLRLDPTVVGSDVLTFSQALASGRHAEAVGAYSGPLLEGFHVDDAPEFEHWLDGERGRLAREYVEALTHLAIAAEQAGAWDQAVGWWARAVECDPVNSRLVVRHMEALAALGDRANALKAAQAHVRRLREELELEPHGEVLARIELIRRGEMPEALRSARHLMQSAAVDAPPGVEEKRARQEGQAVPTLAREALIAPGPLALQRWPQRVLRAAAIALVILLVAAVGVGRWLRAHSARAHYPRTAIAVLPFQNLSTDTAHTFFAGGLHDELLTQLAKVAVLKVIGRTSVSAYQETSKPLRLIGEELRVGSIVEGSVQVVGDRLRVIVQLVDPVTETHLWAEHYDRRLRDAFAVQSDIAQRVVTAVGATLTSAEAGAIAAAPTQNAEAYQLYLQGVDYWRRPGEARENLEIAQQLWERAVALDSTFALAHAALSLVHGDLYVNLYDPSRPRAAVQRREAERALRLAPDLGQAHLAMGVVHYIRSDFGQALEEFNVALRATPNDAEVWEWTGLAQRRLGNWDSALVAFEHASRLEPRDVNAIQEQGYTLEWVRRYGEAITAFRQALALAPDLVRAHIEIGWVYMKWEGDWDTLNAVVGGLPVETFADDVLGVHMVQRQADTVLALLRVIRGPAPRLGLGNAPRAMTAGEAHLLQGDSIAAHVAFDSAATSLDSIERTRPDDWAVHDARGIALALLGRRADALREVRWLERSDVYRRDHFYGRWAAGGVSVILARLGETDAALAELEQLLARPSHLSVYELRVNPLWDPIRSDPRFQALVAKYTNPEGR